MKLTKLDKILFAVVAVLAAIAIALLLFGCDVETFDGDAGEDASAEDAGQDAGSTSLPCPSECLSPGTCNAIGGAVLGGVSCSTPTLVCCTSPEM